MSLLAIEIERDAKIVSETRYYLQNRPQWMTYTRICKDTGISNSWLNKFPQTNHKSATKRLMILHDYLVQHLSQIKLPA